MKLPILIVTTAFAATSIAATIPADQSRTSTSDTVQQTQQAQDSANGSMTKTDLTGNVSNDTSELSTGTTSGTTSGAIIDHTSKKKKRKKKKSNPQNQDDSVSGTTSSGEYGDEGLNSPTNTAGKSMNDEIGLGRNGNSDAISNGAPRAGQDNSQSSSSGGGL